jgi:Protein of unknown function (DUF4238)
MGNRVKNQHFVPQFYLRRFADSNEHLFVYDKRTDKSFPNNVKNIAHESYFYDIPKEWTEPGADSQERRPGTYSGVFTLTRQGISRACG